MSITKVLANKIFSYRDQEGNVVISALIAKEYNYTANLAVEEFKGKDIQLQLKEYKRERTIQQNNCAWAVITKISEAINASKRTEDVMKVYCDILTKSNIKSEYVMILEEALERFQINFRAVVPIEKREINGKQMLWVKVFYGSSNFDTKEMSTFLEQVLDYANECGVVHSEIESIKGEYLDARDLARYTRI